MKEIIMNPGHEPAEESDTPELPQSDPDAYALIENSVSSRVKVHIAARSHQGNGRPINEDHYLVVRVERSLETVLTNLPVGALPRRFDETAYGMLVADGLDGMPAGGMASAMAVCKIVELVVNTPDWIMKMDRRKAAVVKRRMSERFRKVDEALKQHTEKETRLLGMGTTLTVACSLGADLFLGHIGDSRAYLLRGDDLHQLTHDHTLAQALIDAGIGEAENAIVLGMRRVLTSALGTAHRKIYPQVERWQLCHGDQLLLCTDGLTESVDAETIKSVLLAASSAGEACGELVENAVSSGGDNVTVILARYSFPQNA
jgi:serine/threonine protein phosphatase PrpC